MPATHSVFFTVSSCTLIVLGKAQYSRDDIGSERLTLVDHSSGADGRSHVDPYIENALDKDAGYCMTVHKRQEPSLRTHDQVQVWTRWQSFT